jgi:hypothetical protein
VNTTIQFSMEFLLEIQLESQKNRTVYKIDTIDVDGEPEVLFKCLKKIGRGERI